MFASISIFLKNFSSKIGSKIKKIKRPVMWLALIITGLVYMVFSAVYGNIDIGKSSPEECEMIGMVEDIESKDGINYIYLKDIEVITENESFRQNIEVEEYKKYFGCICMLKNSAQDTKYVDDTDIQGMNAPGPQLYIGSKVRLKGKITVIDKAGNPGEFDARKYYVSKGYLYRAYNCKIEESDGKEKKIKHFFYDIRIKASSYLDSALNEEDSGIMKALMFADKTDLDAEIKDLYSDAGAGHLLAISGLHITMLASMVMFLFKKLPINNNIAYLLTIGVLIFYGLLIGFTPSALRAIVMFSLLCIGKMKKRSYDPLTSLAVAAMITVIVKPLYVLQSGFLMSYLAIIGISVVHPIFEIIGKKIPKPVNALSMSGSIFLTTLPVNINSYYKIPIYAPFLNLILIPGMSVILFAGLLCIISEALYEGGFNLFALMIHFMLMLYEWFLKAGFMLPKAVVITGARNPLRCILYEMILLSACVIISKIKLSIWRQKRLLVNYERKHPFYNTSLQKRKIIKQKRQLFLIAFSVISLNVFMLLFYVRTNKVEFLDVGQGLCACVQYNGQVYMFDGGSTDKKNIGKYVIKPYLQYYGISTVDAWFLSHEDADHTNGVVELMEENPNSNIYNTTLGKDIRMNNGSYMSGLRMNEGNRDEIKIKMIIIPEVLSDEFKDIKEKTKIYDISDNDTKEKTKMYDISDNDTKERSIAGDLSDKGKENVRSVFKTEVIEARAGDIFVEKKHRKRDGDNIEFIVISPDKYREDSNISSMVILMKTADVNVLFMADAGEYAQELVLSYISDLNSNIKDKGQEELSDKEQDEGSDNRQDDGSNNRQDDGSENRQDDKSENRQDDKSENRQDDGSDKREKGRSDFLRKNERDSFTIDVLQVAHHGSSNNTNSREFINAISPKIAIISCGYDNPYGHPHAEVIERLETVGCDVLRTDTDGAITVYLAND